MLRHNAWSTTPSLTELIILHQSPSNVGFQKQHKDSWCVFEQCGSLYAYLLAGTVISPASSGNLVATIFSSNAGTNSSLPSFSGSCQFIGDLVHHIPQK